MISARVSMGATNPAVRWTGGTWVFAAGRAAGDGRLERHRSDYTALLEALVDDRLDLDRAEELFKEGLASEENVTAARTNARIEKARVEAARHRIDQYEANLAKAHHDLEKVTISAPMSGVITRLNVEEGENAIMGTLNNPGTVLLVIADLGTMEAWVEVDDALDADLRRWLATLAPGAVLGSMLESMMGKVGASGSFSIHSLSIRLTS